MAGRKGKFVYSSGSGGSSDPSVSAPTSLQSPRKRKRSVSPPKGERVFGSVVDINISDDNEDFEEALQALENYERSQRDNSPPEVNITRPSVQPQPMMPSSQTRPRLEPPSFVRSGSYPPQLSTPRPSNFITSSQNPQAPNITRPNLHRPPINITRPKLGPSSELQNRPGYPQSSSQSFSIPPASQPPVTSRKEESRDERLLAMDGEIKILRQKLHDRDEEKRALEQEKRTLEQEKRKEFEALKQEKRKEFEALKADLIFKEKENADLKEKLEEARTCERALITSHRGLESKSESKSVKSVSTVSGKRSHVDFESTETFMPTSQVSHSKIVPVTFGSKKRRSNSTSHTQATAAASMSVSKEDKGSQTGHNIKFDIRALSLPEPTGPELLRLLLQRNLLLVPDLKALEDQLNTVDHQEEEEKELVKAPGLLSLLPSSPALPSSSSSSSSSSLSTLSPSSLLITPINRKCAAEAGRRKTTPLTSTQKAPLKRTLSRFSSIESLDSDTSFSKISTPQNHPAPPSAPPHSNLLPSLQDSLASFLSSADNRSSTLFSAPSYSFTCDNKMPHYSLEAFTKDPRFLTASDNGLSLLPTFESVLESYLQEQVRRKQKKKALAESSPPSYPGGTVTIDSGSSNPFSASEGSFSEPSNQAPSDMTESSERSSVFSATKVFQKTQVLEVALALETLCKYSSQVREVLILKKPHFSHSDLQEVDGLLPPHYSTLFSEDDDDDDSSMDESDGNKKYMDRVTFSKGNDTHTTQQKLSPPPPPPPGMVPLADYLGNVVSRYIYIKEEHVDKETRHDHLTPKDATLLQERGSIYTGNLFDVMIGLVNNLLWEENVELLCSILESLTVIGNECPVESLERYTVLLKQDSVLVSLLLLENPEVTLKVVSLASALTRSQELVQLFCSNSKMCPLDHFYALYVPRAVIPSIRLKTRIELQLTRMLSALASTDDGERILYESVCCSYQFLKSLTSSLLNALRDLKSDELREDAINSNSRRLCAMEMVRLIHLVCSNDRHIEEHKSECYHKYVASLTRAHEAFKDTNVEELLLDLLEYEGISEEDITI